MAQFQYGATNPSLGTFDPQSLNNFGGMDIPALTGIPSLTRDFSGINVPALTGIPKLGWQGALQNKLGAMGLGANLETMNLGLDGLKTIGGLWAALGAQKVAKQQLAFTRATTNANLANQTQSYNTTLADRARVRAGVEGRDQAYVNDYVAQNSLKPRTV